MISTSAYSVERPTEDRLVFGGELDLSNAPLLKAHLDEWMSQNLPSYTLDLRPTTLIDSSGLGLVVGAYRRALSQESPPAHFEVRATGPVLNVIRLIGLDRVITVIPE